MTALPHTPAAEPDLRDFATAIRTALAEDQLLHLIVFAQIAATLAVWLLVGRPGQEAFFSYMEFWLLPALWLTAAGLALGAFMATLRERLSSPVRALCRHAAALCTPRLLAGLATFAVLAGSMGAFTTVKTLLPALRPYSFDPLLAEIDRALHFGHDPWALMQPVLGQPSVTKFIEAGYHGVWTLMLGLCPLAVALLCKDRLLRTQFLLAFVLAWILFGNLLAGAVLSGGPAFYGLLTGDAERYAAMLDYLRQASPGPVSAVGAQGQLWSAYQEGRSGLGYGISAFPSMHVTISCLYVFLGRRLHPALGAAAALFALFIIAGSVHLGWHYALESYFVLLAVGPLWAAAGALARHEHRRLGPQPTRMSAVRSLA